MTPQPTELADGLHRWTARHPEWHPGEFGAEVASYAVDAGGGHAVLVDPLLPDEDDAVLALLDRLVTEQVTIAVTIPYHVRDAEPLWRRYAERGADARIVGHRGVARRLGPRARFEELVPGEPRPGLTAHTIGRPRRNELPLHLPSHDAIVFGDALVTVPSGELRIWHNQPIDDDRVRFYAERFSPTLQPLIDLGPARILVTHGEPILEGGRAALEDAVAAGPWFHRG
jgi:hypothetical protein